MLVLGFESSCDETGVALYDTEHGLLAHALHSQVDMHAEFGGVVPELASRDHIRRALPLTELVLKNANKTLKDVQGVLPIRKAPAWLARFVGGHQHCPIHRDGLTSA